MPENFRHERDSNPDLWVASAELYQSSYQANWDQANMWVIYKPVDAEIADRWDLYSHSYRQDHPLTHFLICCPAETEA